MIYKCNHPFCCERGDRNALHRVLYCGTQQYPVTCLLNLQPLHAREVRCRLVCSISPTEWNPDLSNKIGCVLALCMYMTQAHKRMPCLLVCPRMKVHTGLSGEKNKFRAPDLTGNLTLPLSLWEIPACRIEPCIVGKGRKQVYPTVNIERKLFSSFRVSGFRGQ